jgi:hypothetical protein
MTNLQSTPQIILFYPSLSLRGQLQSWSEQRGGRQMQISFERSLAGIRRQVRRVDFVLVDATEDPAQASDAYFQVYKTVGPESMAVYTESVHDGLEFMVRRLGVTLLLGPMSASEWDDFFVHKFPRTIPLSSAQSAGHGPAASQDAGDEQPAKEPYPVKSIAG